ncbi:Protein yceI precursor [hydrothermal vent metagenome]|uniref:Protein yceI n=1 Tax=hydrothermal vent metagenome TaxID=652676 RepID=A0A3B1CC93_9ZZZZ
MFIRSFLILALSLTLVSSSAFAAEYDVDKAHSSIGFAVKHMVISSVRGNFTDFKGEFEIDENALTHVKATVYLKSINTNEQKRDKHLLSPDFFDAEMYPEMLFISTKVTHSGNKYSVTGELTIKAITKSVTLKGELLGVIKDPWGNERAGFHAEGKINRKEFGISFHKLLEAGGLVVGDEVTIILDIEGIKRKKK